MSAMILKTLKVNGAAPCSCLDGIQFQYGIWVGLYMGDNHALFKNILLTRSCRITSYQ